MLESAIESLPLMQYIIGMKGEPTKADMMQYLTCWLCKGVYRDAHTINECMCTYCKGCIYKYFTENATRYKCPSCHSELGGKPLEYVVRDQILQNIVDSLIPDFKERDDKLKSILLKRLNEKRIQKGTYKPPVSIQKQTQSVNNTTTTENTLSQNSSGKQNVNIVDIEFKLVPLNDEDVNLRMPELPKKLKISQKNKTILTVKKHINKLIQEAIDNIEILCKNFPVADSHSLEYIRKTKWQNNSKTMVLQYKRKRKIVGNNRQDI
ncbi:polycomb group ring finger protein 3-like [Stylonychia lemnae]|uniref:Polycomb group ring finger protein 3-like n=1 Tax=Stylonychia lemnae TaxID=5949 RepID=A0A078B2U4_STYLE|nr:polycomb group ring finger protein 3-like [Stylonychia lemnae]|eukprot:CDW87542.1 polycomb group ring finger protein 3-like [Stylonychia lemnae]